MSAPVVLLPYQERLLRATGNPAHNVVICEKSRRIGMTWAIAADAVLSAASTKTSGGSDVFYIGYNLDMTREFVDTCAMWAKAFNGAAIEVSEFLFHDQDETNAADRAIKAFRITFASGFEILALCSRPRSLRGRQGYVIIDEAAFHDELDELLKAALALLIWGGRVLVISTHNGAENPFNQLLEDCRAGRRRYHVVRTTFDEAIADGLYQRVCLTRELPWSPAAEAEWAAGIRKDYGDAASEELDCVPRMSGGKYLARTLLEARATPAPVLRFECDDKFVDLPDFIREAAAKDWLDAEVLPRIRAMAHTGRTYVGEDFGRSGDLSVQWPMVLTADLRRHTPFVLELRNVPFRQQEQILFALCDALPLFSGAALDARGNGQYLAEVARQKYGPDCIAEVMLTEGWYREHMPPVKAALEDDTLDLPRSSDIIDDFRALEVVNGVARIVERTTSSDGGKRHGDSAIACALAFFASRTLDDGPMVFAGGGNNVSRGGFADLPGVSGFKDKLGGWN